jgi:hypothetical protein
MLERSKGINCWNMEANIRFARNIVAFILTVAVMGLPDVAAADHVPDNLSQDLDPNYIACLNTVDDAETEFRDSLQSTCIQRMGDLCSGSNGIAPPSQVIDCIHYEVRRGIVFLQVAANDLPEAVEKDGFFGHGYERRRDGILKDVEALKNSAKPLSIEIAVQQGVMMASAATTLFWLARETGTTLEAHVAASFGDH